MAKRQTKVLSFKAFLSTLVFYFLTQRRVLVGFMYNIHVLIDTLFIKSNRDAYTDVK